MSMNQPSVPGELATDVTADVTEPERRRMGWRGYVGLAAGAIAVGGGVWALADPEGARAFGESLLGAITPHFHPLFESPVYDVSKPPVG